MSDALHHFFVSQALHLREGRIESLARAFSVPLLVLLPRNVGVANVLRSRAAIETFFTAKFEGLEAAGIDYLRAQVKKIEQTSSERFMASVVWYYVGRAGLRQGETRARYYVARRSGGFRAEMIAFDHLAFPAIADWIALSAQTIPSAAIRMH